MDPTAVATLLKDYGWPGALAILAAAVVFLYRENQQLQAACRDEGRALLERVITAMNDAATSRGKLADTLVEVSATVEDVSKAVVQSSQAQELRDERWKGWAKSLDDRLGARIDSGGRMNGGSP